jgi:Fe-S-cluster containining protein
MSFAGPPSSPRAPVPREPTVDLPLDDEGTPSALADHTAALQAQLDDLLSDVQRLAAANARNEKMLAEFRTIIDTLLQILVVRGALDDGHLAMMEKLRRHARLAAEPQIALGTTDDKYSVELGEVDCAALMHLCHGRCCSFNIPLSTQDLSEGKLAWRVRQPYLLAQSDKGYCVYQAEDSGGCGNYEVRPAPCRTYDCRNDTRVWVDYERRIAAPMPDGLITIRRRAAQPR